MIIIPYLLTFLTGSLVTITLTKDKQPLDPAFFCGLSLLAGMATSIFLTFLSFVCLNGFHLIFITFMHVLAILGLSFYSRKTINTIQGNFLVTKSSASLLVIIIISWLLSLAYARIYPFGGWDAWQVWNFKSKFLMVSGDRWKDLLLPMLWRSSPHYPLGLPLFNAWIWGFIHNTSAYAPLINTIIFNTTSAILILGIIRQNTQSNFSILPAIFLFAIPSYMILATSQYCDIVIAIFLLGALGIILQIQKTPRTTLCGLAGLFIGTLSFTKPEGAILAGLVFLAAHIPILKQKNTGPLLRWLWAGTLIAGVPTILFELFLSPGNQTFINGLASAGHHANLLRLKIILAFLFVEISSPKWGFLWWLILLASLLNLNRIFRKDLILFPVVIFSYLLIVLLYYWVNTYFKIEWWLSVSLSRILSSLMPAIIAWISVGVLKR